jgi:hypothetical protein
MKIEGLEVIEISFKEIMLNWNEIFSETKYPLRSIPKAVNKILKSRGIKEVLVHFPSFSFPELSHFNDFHNYHQLEFKIHNPEGLRTEDVPCQSFPTGNADMLYNIFDGIIHSKRWTNSTNQRGVNVGGKWIKEYYWTCPAGKQVHISYQPGDRAFWISERNKNSAEMISQYLGESREFQYV